MKNQAIIENNKNVILECYKLAVAGNNKFFGIEMGRECYRDDTYDKYGRYDGKCVNGGGGEFALSVYRVPRDQGR